MTTISVNGQPIGEREIAAEMQFHPAGTREEAWRQAAIALAIRALLCGEAARLAVRPDSEEGGEESLIRTLLAREVHVPQADEAACRRYHAANRARFRSPDIYEAAHILFPAAPDDEAARERVLAQPLKRFTPHTVTDPDKLRIELGVIRTRGYSIDDQEMVLGVFCVGMPIVDRLGRPVGAISISGPSPKAEGPELQPLVDRLAEATGKVSRRLGYAGPRPPVHVVHVLEAVN